MLVMFIIVVKLRTFALVRGLRLKIVNNSFKENDQNKKKSLSLLDNEREV